MLRVKYIFRVLFSICIYGGFAFSALADEAPKTGTLKFKTDGTFKIVQFTDIHNDKNTDRRTAALIESVCDDQQPDVVILTGDNITGKISSAGSVKKAINGFASLINSRKIPWFIAFGNHDDDHASVTGMTKDAQLEYYMSFSHNINIDIEDNITGAGNMFINVYHSDGYQTIVKDEPAFILWALDSGTYAHKVISGQPTEGLPKWDWIRYDQIEWYVKNSKSIEAKYGKVPGFMFFHIPIFEFSLMWDQKEKHGVTGEKNENISCGPFNGGLFSAILERGDIKGVFCGHDHVNNYIGNYYGVYLGYAASAGFGPYGLGGSGRNRLRGARVFILNENNPENFESYMVYAHDYGIR
ncbi:MAG: metallophosphoesterase family protein [Spirochaetota bacterium]